ncbi:sigma-70 family RNA polymerase sigma factor [Spirillospora sp. NPDC052269]
MPRWSPPDVATRRLVRRLNDGDAEALAMLYDAYAERLFDFAAAMTGDVRAADDIVHDAFVDAWRRAPRVRDHANLRIWLYGAVRRRCLQRGHAPDLRWEPNRPFSYPSPRRSRRPDARPSAVLPPTAELRSLLESAVNRLDSNERELLLLTVRHGLHPAELGLLWGLSRRRVTALIGGARVELEASLQDALALAAGSCARRPASTRRTDWANGTSTDRTGTSPGPRTSPSCGESAARSPVGSGEFGAQSVVRVRGLARSVLRFDAPARFGGRGTGGARPESGSGRRAAAHARPRPGASSRLCGRRTESGTGSQDVIDGALNEHIQGCTACRARGQVRAAGLLVLAPASAPSDALRRRVLHTATDPELAGYRADIAGRGGALTPEGLPTQPDIASPYARRWMFATGGMGGALLTALAAIVFMGSQLGVPTFDWPLRPLPSVTATTPHAPSGRGGHPQARGPAGGGGQQPPAPQFGDHSKAPSYPGKRGRPPAAPPPPPPPTTPPVTPRSGTLKVLTTRLELYGRSSGSIRLKAEDGPVTWSAESSSQQITLQDQSGGLSPNGSRDVMVTLHTGLINLPGRATLTFTGPHGPPQAVTVVWGISVL